jgi:hypothetical protein
MNGLGIDRFSCKYSEGQGKIPAIKSDVVPSSILGTIGAVIDKKQGQFRYR